ncbi:potassium transporter Trk [Microbacterium sp.]|uniref:potassium transporter Trk n=1 Tax=Microbacterium sp. TaxID=51671 RepID=UPI003A92C0E9
MTDEANEPQAGTPQTAPGAAVRVPVELVEESVETVTVRRAPKMLVFLVLGAALGVLVALILTYGFGVVDAQGNEPSTVSAVTFTKSQVFGFLVLVCGVGGLAVGGIVALILERTLGRRTKRVQVDRESVTTAD